MTNCRLDGCNNQVKSRGLCNAHYLQHRNAGTLEDVAAARFASRGVPVHSLTEVNRETLHAICSMCGPVAVRLRSGRGGRAAECTNARRASRPSASDRRRARYKVTPEQLERMLVAAGGACEICDIKLDDTETRLDHCHETGAARGILCQRCNVGLGWFNDDPARLLAAILYLNGNGKALAG